MVKNNDQSVEVLLRNTRDLDKLAKVMQHCRVCDLSRSCTRTSGRGNPKADYFFVLSERDDTAEFDKLFGEYTSRFFTTSLRKAKINTKDIWITPVTTCHPTKRDDDIQEKHINACKARVIKEIHLVQPLLVIMLGTKAAKATFAYVRDKPSVEKHEGLVMDASVAGDIGRYSIPALLTETPILLMRFPDESEYGSWKRFDIALAHAREIVEKLKEVRRSYEG